MATWAKCPELFLYTKGKDVYLWRCNETTWMPMKTADFDDLGKVMDHLDLVGGRDALFDWEERSYMDLVAYISSRRLLVNSQGLVIAELHKFDQDGKMEENGLPFYIRSLDVLSLKPFGLRDRTIPSRTVWYLETEGRAAPVEDSTTSTTTSSSTELDEGKLRADMEKQVVELKAANKTLNDRNKSLAEDVAAQKTAAEKAQQECDAARRDKEAAERIAADLQTQIDSLAINEKKEVWMNKFSDQLGNWKTFDGLNKEIYRIKIPMPTHRGSFTKDDDLTTNVRSSYFHLGSLVDANNVSLYLRGGTTGWLGYKAVRLDDLNPNKEMARFNVFEWYRGTYNGDMYAIKEHYPATCSFLPPGDSSKLSADEVKSLNLLGS